MRLFISYRRSDSMDEAHTLQKALLRISDAEYPIEIFIDTEKIKPGQDFEKKMIKELENADVVLAIIGNKWLHAMAENDNSIQRINREDDPVRLELEKALVQKIPIVVVLLDNASQPSKNDLPISLAGLQAAPHFKFNTDFDEFEKNTRELVRFLKKFPVRRPNESVQKAQLGFHNSDPGWLQSDSPLDVIVNGKKIGEILANKKAYRFSLDHGTYEIQLKRGLIYRSNKLTVKLSPGNLTTILYDWHTFGGIEIKTG